MTNPESNDLCLTAEDFHAIFRVIPLPIILHAGDGSIIGANPAFLELFGYTLDELRQLRSFDLLHADNPPQLVANIRAVHEGRIPALTGTCAMVCKDGSTIWARGHLAATTTAEATIVLTTIEDRTASRWHNPRR